MYILPKKQLTNKEYNCLKIHGEKKTWDTYNVPVRSYVTGHCDLLHSRALWFTALECCCARQEHTGKGLWRICKWLILCKTLETSNNLGSDQKLLVVTTNPYHSYWFLNYPIMTHTFLNPWILFRFCTLLVEQPVPLQPDPELLKVQEPSQRILSLYLGVTGTKLSSSYLELKIEPTNLWFLS